MIETTPQVFLIGEPKIRTQEMLAYLKEVRGEAWYERVFLPLHDVPGGDTYIPPAEGLVEFMGRLCYKSWEPGLNLNVTKIREDRGDYLLNILRMAHGSVLHHAWFNFVIHNGSRVFTAEMNRHAVGTAISEQSLRFVRLDKDLPFRSPAGVLKPETIALGGQLVQHIEETIGEMYAMEGIDDEETFFAKKTITSAIRRYAPLGMSTEEGWSGNVRAIRHVIEMRTAAGAEEEIRIIADQIARKMQVACPALFGDYVEDYNEVGTNTVPPVWKTDHRKV